MKRERIGLVLGLALLVGIAVFPIPGIPDEARRMLAVAAIMATWWVTEAAPLAVTSLLPLVLLPVFGITNAAGAAAPYANHLVYLFLGGFMIAQAMQRWNLHRRIALRTVMLMGSSPPRLVLGFMVASAFLSMWVSNTATTAMMMPIGVAVIAEISSAVHGRDRRPAPGEFPFAVCLMLGCAYGASIGGFATLIGTPPNVFLAGFLEEELGIQITFVRWLAFAMPLTIIFLPATWLWLTKFAFPIRIRDIPGGREPVRAAYTALGPLSTPEKRLAILFGGTALLWILRPVWTQAIPTGGFITDSTIAMAATGAVLSRSGGRRFRGAHPQLGVGRADPLGCAHSDRRGVFPGERTRGERTFSGARRPPRRRLGAPPPALRGAGGGLHHPADRAGFEPGLDRDDGSHRCRGRHRRRNPAADAAACR